MKIKLPLKKENVKIVQNIKKRYNTKDLRIDIEKDMLIIECEQLEIINNDYVEVDKSFIDNLIMSIENFEEKRDYFKIERKENNVIIQEIGAKSIFLTLTKDNTIILEKLRNRHKKKLNQMEIVNMLIAKGTEYIDEIF